MLSTILGRELREGCTSYTFILMVALQTLLVPLTAYSQAQYYQKLVKDYDFRRSVYLAAEGDSQVTVITRSVPELLPIVNGSYRTLPNEIILDLDSSSRRIASPDIDPVHSLFPQSDLGMLVGVLTTLMAIIFMHDSISGEREQGTLKQLLSAPVPRSKLLAAKLLGGVLVCGFILLYTIALYVAVVALFSKGAFRLTAKSLPAIGALYLVSWLVLTFYAALALGVSASVRRSSSSLALTVGVWILLTLVWPALAPRISCLRKPAAAEQSFRREVMLQDGNLIKAELEDHRKAAQEVAENHDSTDTARSKFVAIKKFWIEQRRLRIGGLNAERDQQLIEQQELADRLLVLSPNGMLAESAEDLCETGFQDHNQFVKVVESFYRDTFLPATLDSLGRKSPKVGDPSNGERVQAPQIEGPFTPLSERLCRLRSPLIIIATETLLAILFSVFQFRRYDVR